jgi:hypothetical protein
MIPPVSRNRSYTSPQGQVLTWRVERKYLPNFIGESLIYLFRPEDGSPRFTILVQIPGILVPRLGPEFDRLAEAGWPYVRERLEAGERRDLGIRLRENEEPELFEVTGLRKFPLPGADGGEIGSWG